MTDSPVLLVTGNIINEECAGQHELIMKIVRGAHEAHEQQNVLPSASILRFPNGAGDRIVALPAHIQNDEPATRLKWVSSFPGNAESGLERASVVILLNSVNTGRVSSMISTRRGRRGSRVRVVSSSRGGKVSCAADLREVIETCPLVSFATTAVTLHVADLSRCQRSDA